MPKKKTKKTTPYGIKFFAKQTILVFRDVFLMLTFIATVLFGYIYFKTPAAATLLKRPISQTTIIYDRAGEHILYEIHGEENRKIIPHEQIPAVARIATIAAEDDSFYTHHGIDFFAIIRALKIDIESNSIQQGGSTITQQLARNALLTRDKTIQRKLAEITLAIKIENKYSKDQILDMYFNEIPYGSNTYGIEAASETFFGKKASDLNLDEAAFLVALPKAPTYYSPYGENKMNLEARRNKILDRIASLGLIDPQKVTEAKKIDTLKKVVPFSQSIEAPHFVMYVRDELEKMYGKTAMEEGGLKVYTTLNYDMQKNAEKIISEEADGNMKRYGASNAALVSLDPTNGEILAMVGSKNYFDSSIDGQVNVALSPRQPGSSFKPFAYAAAFEKGYQPETLLLDAQTNFGPDGSGRPYIPQNYDGKFHGVVSMRQALAMSLNIPAVKTLYLASIDNTIELAHRMGITTLNDRQRYGLSLVLGGGEVKLLDMVSGFSVFANDGRGNHPEAILKIVDSKGKVYTSTRQENIPVLDEQVARKINSILSDNASRIPIFGPNNRLFIPGKTVAAKTGTTQEYRDAWTIGYTPYLVTGVWAGNNDNHSMGYGADGSYVAAPIWNRFMSQAIQNHSDETFVAYNRVENKSIATVAPQAQIAYFRKNSGKRISEKKAMKADQSKIEIRTIGDSSTNINQSYFAIDRTLANDPMIKNWISTPPSKENN